MAVEQRLSFETDYAEQTREARCKGSALSEEKKDGKKARRG